MLKLISLRSDTPFRNSLSPDSEVSKFCGYAMPYIIGTVNNRENLPLVETDVPIGLRSSHLIPIESPGSRLEKSADSTTGSGAKTERSSSLTTNKSHDNSHLEEEEKSSGTASVKTERSSSASPSDEDSIIAAGEAIKSQCIKKPDARLPLSIYTHTDAPSSGRSSVQTDRSHDLSPSEDIVTTKGGLISESTKKESSPSFPTPVTVTMTTNTPDLPQVKFVNLHNFKPRVSPTKPIPLDGQ